MSHPRYTSFLTHKPFFPGILPHSNTLRQHSGEPPRKPSGLRAWVMAYNTVGDCVRGSALLPSFPLFLPLTIEEVKFHSTALPFRHFFPKRKATTPTDQSVKHSLG
jgi:hypothetical protein